MAQLFAGADIRRLAREENCRYLLLGAGDRITPEAADVARQLGVQVHREGEEAGSVPLPPLVSRQAEPRRGVRVFRLSETVEQPFAFDVGRPEMDIRCTDVLGKAEGSPMAAGIMSWRAGSFPWTLNYDEIDLVLEGQLEIRHGGKTTMAYPGDVVFIPKGSEIHFGSPSQTKVFYVTYPADWESR